MAEVKLQEGGSSSSSSRHLLDVISWNSWADTKLLLIFLLCFCSLLTLFQFFPLSTPRFSPSVVASCFSKHSSGHLTTSASVLVTENFQSDSIVIRAFHSVGSAAYLFVQMGAYRAGPDCFAVVGLSSKPIHVFGKPQFRCEWQSNSSSTASAGVILPDWGYGRVYTVAVLNCTFPAAVGLDGDGGRLVVHANAAAAATAFVALEETPGSVTAAAFSARPKYERLYCGSPLYGDLSPQRVREWMAHHARLFGERSHFVFHNAGGVHPGVREVLRPWMEIGVVALQDVREQERFDGYYHNQFLIVNDCLHRYRFAAEWIFFFDVDEFIYLPARTNLASLLASIEIEGYSQFTIDQMSMSGRLCRASDSGKTARMWGVEKLVYRDVKRVRRRDRKYAVRPRAAFAAGVHMSQNVAGRSLHKTEGRIKYFHYHGTIADRRDPWSSSTPPESPTTAHPTSSTHPATRSRRREEVRAEDDRVEAGAHSAVTPAGNTQCTAAVLLFFS